MFVYPDRRTIFLSDLNKYVAIFVKNVVSVYINATSIQEEKLYTKLITKVMYIIFIYWFSRNHINSGIIVWLLHWTVQNYIGREVIGLGRKSISNQIKTQCCSSYGIHDCLNVYRQCQTPIINSSLFWGFSLVRRYSRDHNTLIWNMHRIWAFLNLSFR